MYFYLFVCFCLLIMSPHTFLYPEYMKGEGQYLPQHLQHHETWGCYRPTNQSGGGRGRGVAESTYHVPPPPRAKGNRGGRSIQLQRAASFRYTSVSWLSLELRELVVVLGMTFLGYSTRLLCFARMLFLLPSLCSSDFSALSRELPFFSCGHFFRSRCKGFSGGGG